MAARNARRNTILAMLAGVVAVAFIVAAATATDHVDGEPTAVRGAYWQEAAAGYTQLEQASQACGQVGTVGDDGHTLTIDTPGTDLSSGDDSETWLECVFDYASMPDSVMAQMNSTRALDGMQSAEWDGFAASWTYHPDAGLDVILTEE